MFSDRENFITIANFAAKLYEDGESYELMFKSFKEIGLFENIGILLPNNSFVTKNGTIKYVNMILRYMYEHNIHSKEVTDDFVQIVTDATVLHDVGKIRISDIILNKPGQLTPEEYEVMKNHVELGGKIDKDIFGKVADGNLVRIAANIARYHHERWDGKGYPEGISGTNIPLSVRIVAVADVFDALISKRVYKEKMSLDESFRI